MLYAAYGSNLDEWTMKRRCRHARPAGTALAEGWRLEYRGDGCGYLTMERDSGGGAVPLLLWEITGSDLRMLDISEGYPGLYGRENIRVSGGRTAMIYRMPADYGYRLPTDTYRKLCESAYRNLQFDMRVLDSALERTKAGMEAAARSAAGSGEMDRWLGRIAGAQTFRDIDAVLDEAAALPAEAYYALCSAGRDAAARLPTGARMAETFA